MYFLSDMTDVYAAFVDYALLTLVYLHNKMALNMNRANSHGILTFLHGFHVLLIPS